MMYDIFFPIATGLLYNLIDYCREVPIYKQANAPASDSVIATLALKLLKNPSNLRCKSVPENEITVLGNSPAMAIGGDWLGCPTILMDSQASVENEEFVCAHEISHIANNDNLLFRGLDGVIAGINILTVKLLWKKQCSLYYLMTTASIALIAARIFCRRFCERRADLQGFAVCSKEGQQQAIQTFLDMAYEHVTYRNLLLAEEENEWRENLNPSFLDKIEYKFITSFMKMVYPSNGNYSPDIFHPAITQRIDYLTKAYQNIHGETFIPAAPELPEKLQGIFGEVQTTEFTSNIN